MRPVKVAADAVGDGLVAAFRARGYAGASLRDLADATGLRSASLYHRFGDGKAAMALSTLAHVGAQFAADVIAPLEQDGPAGARLAASAAGLAAFYAGGARACLLAIFALSDAPADVRIEVASMLARWRDRLAAVLAAARYDAPTAEAEDRIAAIQGALILHRADPASRAFARAITRMEALP